MAFRLPAPRRGIRSLLVLLTLLLVPYLLLRHLSSIRHDEDLPRTNSDLLRNRLEGRNDELVLSDETQQLPFGLNRFFDDDDEEDQPIRMGRSKNRYNEDDEGEEDRGRKGKRPISNRAEHRFLPNGLLIPNIHSPHPIFELISRSKKNWQKKLDGQSKTLSEAVDEYRRRYARNPPRGFERWWAYTERNGVGLRDEYDQIYHDLEPFHALPPTKIQSLLKASSEHSGMYTISCPGISSSSSSNNNNQLSSKCVYKIVETGLNEEGKRVAKERAKAQLGLLEGIEELLEPVKVVMYSHDVPWQFVGHEYKGALEDAASVGEFFNPTEHEIDTAHLGWASACAPHKPLRHDYDPDILPDLDGLWNGDKSFVWDHKATMDPCTHPTLTHLVGFLSGHGKGPAPSKELYPVLAMCKTTLHADVLGVSMEAWTEDVGNDPAWEDKKDDRMLWRGKTTGIYFNDEVPWNISQRINLVSHSAEPLGHIPVFDVPPSYNPNKPVGEPQNLPLSQLNAELMDVAFVDEAIQCDPKICRRVQAGYKFGARKDWSQGNQYKYLLDIDGNGWSARFKRLMSTNSAVLKSTIFPEWYTDRIQPWVHYIPIKADLTDLYDVLSFFRGHDELAKEIAVEGKRWSKAYWRKEDMIAYQFRLFLEYARLLADDRDAASFDTKGVELRKRAEEYREIEEDADVAADKTRGDVVAEQ
ncbi:hypothetical protein I302_104301 [Kwoniella bestiolae CBS 10118]|uniref:Glycosyl transferase CAP10 domain-containing protein n=1 Tax=Kwoniella bestiolae CBS 10118 TaxID=1296100 RepID=A0AAJ8K7B6_9TREE